MSRKSLILSSSGLKNIININGPNDEFIFVLGDEEIHLSKFSAEFISPLISNIHRSDPTLNISEYGADEHTNEVFTKAILHKIELLCQGESIEIDADESKKLEIISILLCNDELQDKLSELYPINILGKSMKEDIYELSNESEIKQKIGLKNQMAKNKIEFISSNFYKLDKGELEELSKLPKSLLHSILCHPKIKLLNEDSLFDFIQNLVKDENENISELY